MMGDKINVMEGSDNVFADLDVSEPEQALAKAELARKIGDVIQHRRLTQTRAAKLLGIDQPKVSALIRGRLTGFSTDRLMRFLIVLGRDVDIVVRATRRSK
ncbi:MAG: XRE family transcriptional regulator, partial [Deltaproteobacteria bacterium RIFOXYA12_FULL_58_15]